MTELTGPVLDNHLHLHPDGKGLAAVDEFIAAGGTHLIVLNRPSWDYVEEVSTVEDFSPGFEQTIEIAAAATERLPGRAWAVLGVHPALMTRLVDDREWPLERVEALMEDGLHLATEYVESDRALAIKSGRPHYPVSEEVWAASNRLIRTAFSLAATADCAIQLHTEAAHDVGEFTSWAKTAGLAPTRVVKHFADGAIEGAIPSVIARTDAVCAAVEGADSFFLETDFLDDPNRPGAVLGPKVVPRRTRKLAEEGASAAICTAHVETPALVYDIDTHATLST